MSRHLLVLLSVLTLAHCGRNTPQSPARNQSSPPSGNSAPQTPAPSPIPAPSGLKWTEQQLNDVTAACAEAGFSDYSYDSWKIFCSCAYHEAARRWTYDDFLNNFNSRYDALSNDGIINKCLSNAGIDLN